ncbi:MAG TPA: hypothetical protein VIO57_16035, partial [Chloroflexota bacterium]
RRGRRNRGSLVSFNRFERVDFELPSLRQSVTGHLRDRYKHDRQRAQLRDELQHRRRCSRLRRQGLKERKYHRYDLAVLDGDAPATPTDAGPDFGLEPRA